MLHLETIIMKTHPVCLLLSLLTVAHSSALSAYGAAAEPIAFPIKVAEGKHTFADAKGWEDAVLVLESPGAQAKPLSGAEAAAPPHAAAPPRAGRAAQPDAAP